MFALELNRRLAASGSPVRSIVAHPGIAATNLAAHVGGVPGLVNRAMRFMVNDAEHGALPILYAASQDIPGGSYIGPDGVGSIGDTPRCASPPRRHRTRTSPAPCGTPRPSSPHRRSAPRGRLSQVRRPACHPPPDSARHEGASAPADSGETPMKMTGNTILVTGGTSGIGLGLALRFHQAGNKVIVAGRRKELLEQIAAEHDGIETGPLRGSWRL